MVTRFTNLDNILQADASGVYEIVDGQELKIGDDGEVTISESAGVGIFDNASGGLLRIGPIDASGVEFGAAGGTHAFYGEAGVVQASHIADSAGSDATAVNAILAVLENLGFVATS